MGGDEWPTENGKVRSSVVGCILAVRCFKYSSTKVPVSPGRVRKYFLPEREREGKRGRVRERGRDVRHGIRSQTNRSSGVVGCLRLSTRSRMPLWETSSF